MLAVIDSKANVVVYDANGKNPIPLTHDADGKIRQYNWPTWSTDGRLAFFGSNGDSADPYQLRAFVVDKVAANAAVQTAFSTNTAIFTYAYWGPADCAPANCRDLALLYTPTDQNTLELRLIRDMGGKFSDKVVGQAAPYYYSFSPDAKQLFWYSSSTELSIYDIASDKVTSTLADHPGMFNVPMWSPTDDRLLFGTVGDKDGQTNIVIAQGDKRQTLVPNLDNPVSFAWSPDGSMVASVANFGQLTVTDAKTGKQIALASERSVVSYFWSPQSDRIAYVVASRPDSGTQASYKKNGSAPPRQQPSVILSWHIMDVKTGQAHGLGSFVPSDDMTYLLSFFDQFSRSHSLWSPDGQYLVYGSVDPSNHDSVQLLDTKTPGAPIKVADGSIGIWSWK
jgi:WD40 repeat protein